MRASSMLSSTCTCGLSALLPAPRCCVAVLWGQGALTSQTHNMVVVVESGLGATEIRLRAPSPQHRDLHKVPCGKGIGSRPTLCTCS